MENSVDAVKQLLGATADANARDAFGCTPLHDAASRDGDGVLRLLLEAHGNAAVRDERGVTPLHRAARAGSVRAASLLRYAGASTSAANAFGRTPVDEARSSGYRGLETLLASPAPWERVDQVRSGTRR
jgi:cytohesin